MEHNGLSDEGAPSRAPAARPARPAATLEKPIIFSAPMVRAIRARHKTQTRRIVRGAPAAAGCAVFAQPVGDRWRGWAGALFFAGATPESRSLESIRSPYGGPGGVLWVREAWALVPHTAYAASPGVEQTPCPGYESEVAIYRAGWDRSPPGVRWRPSIHMPRWACRLRLALLVVRVERLQQITEADAIAEGVDHIPQAPAALNRRAAFAGLWDSIYTKAGDRWADNPWVWAVEFVELGEEVQA